MKRSVICLLICVTMSLALACSRRVGKPSDRDFQIQVVNHSPYDVCYVQVAPNDAEGWGADRLGADEVMRPGDQRAFEMNAGTYRLMLRDCDEIPVMAAVDVASGVTLTVGAEDVVALRLDNRSSVVICDVYLSSSDGARESESQFPVNFFFPRRAWGQDRMAASEFIAPGDVRIFYVVPSFYGLMAADCEHNALVQELGVNLTDDLVTWTLDN